AAGFADGVWDHVRMTRDESSASRAISQALIAAAIGAVLGVVAQRFVIGDQEGATAGGLVGAVLGALASAGLSSVGAQRAEAKARAAPVEVPWPLTVELA